MAMAICRECGKQVSTEAKVCPTCGAVKPSSSPPPTPKTKGDKSKTPRWLIFFLVGIVGVFIVTAVLGLMAGGTLSPTKKPKSELASLCDERMDNVIKYRKYSGEGNFAYAFDVDREIREIDKKLSAYPDAERAKACGFKRDVPVALNAPKPIQQTAKIETVDAGNKSVGCTAAPLETFDFGKTYGEAELRKIFSTSCRVEVGSFDRSVVVEWTGKKYSIDVQREPGAVGEPKFRISSIRSM